MRPALQMRQRTLSLVVFYSSLICYTFVNFDTCKSYVLSWLGYLPSVLVSGFCWAASMAALCLPCKAEWH
jgi:hypothetical protein